MTCGLISQACYRAIVAGNPSNIVQRAIVDFNDGTPEWRDVTTGDILVAGTFVPVSCSENDPEAQTLIPQFISVQHAVLNAPNTVTWNSFQGVNQDGAFNADTDQRHWFLTTDPTFTSLRYHTGGTQDITNALVGFTANQDSGGANDEYKDAWVLLPVALVGTTIEFRANSVIGNNTVGASLSFTPNAPASWVQTLPDNSQVVSQTASILVQDSGDACLAALGYTAVRARATSGDFYFRGASWIEWRVPAGTFAWMDKTFPVVNMFSNTLITPFYGTPSVQRAKDGHGNIIDTNSNVITGEVCYNPPYATWPEPIPA